MQCINCNSEINGVAMVCPFCHTNPSWFGSAPYSGVAPTSNGPGLLDGLITWWNKPAKKKLGPNETTYTDSTEMSCGFKWYYRTCSSCGTKCGGYTGRPTTCCQSIGAGRTTGCGKVFVKLD